MENNAKVIDGDESSERDARVRAAFETLEPDDVGTHAAQTFVSGIELHLFNLLGSASEQEFGNLAEDRSEMIASTRFAKIVSSVCEFAQSGELPAGFDLARMKRAVHAIAESLFLPIALSTAEELMDADAFMSTWWLDPGPIDVRQSEWPVKAAMHLARARILASEGAPTPAIPIRHDAADADEERRAIDLTLRLIRHRARGASGRITS